MSNDEGGVSQSISLHGTYESSLTRFFDRLLVPGATVLDIGANIGWFTVRFSRRIGGAGRVLAFEPEPTNLQILRGNLAENECRNVTVVESVVSDRTGTTTLHLDGGSYGAHSLARANLIHGGREIEVGTVTLADLEPEHGELGSPVVVKSDAQGAEPLIFEAGREFLREQVRVIVFEYWPHGYESLGHSPTDVLKLLDELGFNFSKVPKKDGIKVLDRIDFEAILDAKEYKKYSSLNVVALRGVDPGKYAIDGLLAGY